MNDLPTATRRRRKGGDKSDASTREGIALNADLAASVERLDEGHLGQVMQELLSKRLSLVVADATLPDLPIVYASAAFAALTGYQADEVIGRNCRFLQGPDTDPMARQQLSEAIAAGLPCSTKIVNYRRAGDRFINDLHVEPILIDGRVRYFAGIQKGVTRPATAGVGEAGAPPAASTDNRLRDLRHRTDNVLQMVLSLLRLRRGPIVEREGMELFDDTLERIERLIFVHSYLNRVSETGLVSAKDVFRELCAVVGGIDRSDIDLKLNIEDMILSVDRLLPLVLFASEALANAVRHAFAEEHSGTVTVELVRHGDTGYRLRIADDGVGLPSGLDFPRRGFLGSMLLTGFARQLGGTLEVCSEAGVELILTVPGVEAAED
jgi:PAS domain S-box-containing protein